MAIETETASASAVFMHNHRIFLQHLKQTTELLVYVAHTIPVHQNIHDGKIYLNIDLFNAFDEKKKKSHILLSLAKRRRVLVIDGGDVGPSFEKIHKFMLDTVRSRIAECARGDGE